MASGHASTCGAIRKPRANLSLRLWFAAYLETILRRHSGSTRTLFRSVDADRVRSRRFRKEDVDWPIGDGFHAWVGLNATLQSGRVDILPFVGVHVVPIERLWTSLKTGKWPGKYNRSSATYAVNMGTVEAVADERAFAFGPQQSEGFINSECDRLARIYATGGLDYARSIASYEALLPLFRKQINWLGAFPERYASCLYLMGRKGEARAFVEEFLPKKRDYFEGFAISFLKKLDEEGVTSGGVSA